MRVVVLPFNAAEGTSPALGRQLANYICECVRQEGHDADITSVNYLSQVDDNGAQRSVYVSVADSLLEREWLTQMFEQSKSEFSMDGLLKAEEDTLHLTVRFHRNDEVEPVWNETWAFSYDEIFDKLKVIANAFVALAQIEVADPEAILPFGTNNGRAFCDFLQGCDSLAYLQSSNGAVVRDFSPAPAFDFFLAAISADRSFIQPFEGAINLCLACANFRVGTFDLIKATLEKLVAVAPDDPRPYFAMGEVYDAVGDSGTAADWFELAVEKAPDQPVLLSRLGVAQVSARMPVNAERTFRKALALEGPDKPSAERLATVLAQTNREHEVPEVWKSVIAENPQNGMAHAQYGISLLRLGRAPEAEKVFDAALESLEDPMPVKRWYAPYLVKDKQDYDRAMDFYEDCIDQAPNAIPILLEYAQTLHAADRDFEIPPVLKHVLESNPDPNTRAEVLGWLIELEQPKRAETTESARKKIEQGEFDTAVRELKPLRPWLGDYWKLWALLAMALNRTQEYTEAEESARRLLHLYPGSETGYAELMTALSGQSRFEEAYNVMRHAAQNLPQNLNVQLNLAVSAKRAGHSEEARALAQHIRAAVGPNEELDQVLQEIEA